HAQHTSLVVSFSALPFVIWRLDVALGSRRLQPAIEAGAIWGLSALSGYPALTIFTGCYAALWALGRWLCPPLTMDEPESVGGGSKTTQRLGFRTIFYSLALMALVGSVVLLPSYFGFFYEGAGTHRRVGELSRNLVLSIDAFTPEALMTFASPYLPILKLIYLDNGLSLWPNLDISMCSVYAGALVTVFACFALINHPRDRWRWWLIGVGLFGLACAFGDTLPLRGWLYDWFYPTRFFRHPALFRAYFLFSLLPLALLTARAWAGPWGGREGGVGRVLLMVAALLAGGAFLSSFFLPRHMRPAEVLAGVRWSGYVLAFGVWPAVTIALLI